MKRLLLGLLAGAMLLCPAGCAQGDDAQVTLKPVAAPVYPKGIAFEDYEAKWKRQEENPLSESFLRLSTVFLIKRRRWSSTIAMLTSATRRSASILPWPWRASGAGVKRRRSCSPCWGWMIQPPFPPNAGTSTARSIATMRSAS